MARPFRNRLENDRLSDEQRECIENGNEAAEVYGWYADECLGESEMEDSPPEPTDRRL